MLKKGLILDGVYTKKGNTENLVACKNLLPNAKVISSSRNPLIQLLRTLLESRGRKKHGSFIVEGPKLVLESCNSNLTVEHILLNTNFAKSEEAENITKLDPLVKTSLLSSKLFDKVSPTQAPQGILAIVKYPNSPTIDHQFSDLPSPLMVFDRIQDPSNVGSLMRVAEATGCRDVFYIKGTSDPYSPKSIRASAGSVLRLRLYPIVSVEELSLLLTKNNISLLTMSPRTGVNLYKAEISGKIALVLGNETHGVDPLLAHEAMFQIKIPMDGKGESLNVTSAASVILYEIYRRRTANLE